MRYFKTSLANEAGVYEQLRIGINHLFGYPKTVTSQFTSVTTTTFLPLWADLPKSATHAYWLLRDSELAHEWVGPLMAQYIAGAHVQEVTAEEYFAATEPEEEGPTEPETEPEVIAWAIGQTIAVGDLRTHNGQTWRALLAHTTHEGWAPSQFTPTIWQPQ